jgi:hypothetical protein
MTEPDAAGPLPNGELRPSPNRSRPTSVADVIREIERQRAPLVAEMERAERSRRRFVAEFGLNEEAEPPTPPPEPAKVVAPPAMRPNPETAGRPVFEVDPRETLLAAMRQAFPGFKPTGRWWAHAEMELKTAHHRSNPEAHDAFVAAFWNWSADDLIRHLEAEGRIKRARGGRGRSVCERLRELHKGDPGFAETASERAVAKRIGKKSAGSLSKSAYWLFTLKPKRAEVRARAQLAKAGLRSNAATPSKSQARSDNWGEREAAGRLGDKIDAVEILDKRLQELHRVDPAFAETATQREVAERVGDVPEDCLAESAYWRLTLAPRRDELRARAEGSDIDGGH